jgi:hypothetical protein
MRFISVNRRSVEVLGFRPPAQCATARGENPVSGGKLGSLGEGMASVSETCLNHSSNGRMFMAA